MAVSSKAAGLLTAKEKTTLAYGSTLALWAWIEQRLYLWFEHTTLLEPHVGRAIFYSARSFQGRADMLEAAVEASKLETNDKEFISEGIKKARQFCGFRNRLAHGEFSFDGLNVLQGKHLPTVARQKAITILQIQIAYRNFESLSDALVVGLDFAQGASDRDEEAPLSSLQKCLQQVRGLPHQADLAKPVPKKPKPRRPPRSSQR